VCGCVCVCVDVCVCMCVFGLLYGLCFHTHTFLTHHTHEHTHSHTYIHTHTQTPWIINATVRDNIVCGEIFNRQRYDVCVRVCALTDDFSVLVDGDLTEIGEKGINLSGGQVCVFVCLCVCMCSYVCMYVCVCV